jgi:hypothetical protein
MEGRPRDKATDLRRPVFAVVLATLAAALVVGCGSPPESAIALQSPVEATLAYFQLMNTGNMALAAVRWVPGSPGTSWRDAPPRNVFQNVHCRPGPRLEGGVGDTATDASVSCEFDIQQMWGGFSEGHWQWGVFLRRQPPGPWLIYAWGQG